MKHLLMEKNRPVGHRRDIDMLHGSLADKIIYFVIPLAATGILQQLFNATDVAIVGRLVGSDAMAAVGSNSPVINLLVNLFIGISLGANVVISRCTGMGNRKAISRAVHTAILVAFFGGCLVAVFGILVSRPVLVFMGVPEEILPMALSYLRIYLGGMPIVFLYNYESAIFRSQGDTRTPLLCLLVAGISNVGLNVFFIKVVGMASGGVALATVIANGISFLMMFVILLRTDGPTHLDLRQLRIDVPLFKQMLAIGIPAGLQGMVFSISNVQIQSSINSLGAYAMAGSSAAYNIEILSYFVVNAFGQACTTFTGQNVGAGQRDRCMKVLALCVVMGAIATTAFSLLLFFFRMPILSLFNTKEAVLAYGSIRLLYLLPFEALNMLNDVISGFLRGFGLSLQPALISLIGICGFRLIWVATAFRMHPTFEMLMLVYPISWAVAAALITLCFLLLRKRMLAPISHNV